MSKKSIQANDPPCSTASDNKTRIGKVDDLLLLRPAKFPENEGLEEDL